MPQLSLVIQQKVKTTADHKDLKFKKKQQHLDDLQGF